MSLFSGIYSISVSGDQLAAGKSAYTRGDYSLAFSAFTPLANEGNAEAQTLLGNLYENGLGVIKDEKLALDWYEKAGKAGDAQALEERLQELPPCGAGHARAYFEELSGGRKSLRAPVPEVQEGHPHDAGGERRPHGPDSVETYPGAPEQSAGVPGGEAAEVPRAGLQGETDAHQP